MQRLRRLRRLRYRRVHWLRWLCGLLPVMGRVPPLLGPATQGCNKLTICWAGATGPEIHIISSHYF
jgi:hypothetical protein